MIPRDNDEIHDKRQLVIARTYDEFLAAGRVSDPADGIDHDDDLAFWAEVDRRLRELTVERA